MFQSYFMRRQFVLSCSDVEGGAVSDKGKKKERPKAKRKKTEKVFPRLSVLNIEQEHDEQVVECQLETGKHSSVSFKFNCDADQPEDIADNLVCVI